MTTRLLLLLAAALPWAWAAEAQTPADSVIARGQRVYEEERCRACHSIAGQGNRRYPLDGVGSRLTLDQLRKWIVAPREMDPKVRKRAYDKLSAADVEALVSYLASLRKAP